ncbi:hypothetical protein OKW30_007843 [Paraburkholderia sp. Clong3]|uniref:AprA-related methyltransferase n=1 Tax=Paraburkholderia sp. Clong3 TaxID=2991061 RepID=UPI003D2409D7
MAEGLAIAPAIDSLIRHDAVVARADTDVPSASSRNPGLVGVARRALAQQGRLTPGDAANHDWLRRLDDYRHVPALLDLCHALLAGEPGNALRAMALLLRAWRVASDFPDRIATELLAFVAAPTLLTLADSGCLPPFRPESFPLPADVWPVGAAGRHAALRWLGWVDGPAAAPQLTTEGRMAAAFSGQFRYPLSYLPMLTRMDSLLFGDPGIALARSGDATERHLDRAADIRFSTEVFQRSCAPILSAMVVPLFHRSRGDSRPRVVVDVGCGEATLLVSLLRAIAGDPASADAAENLLLVGVENNPVAEQAAKRTLATCGAKHVLIRGDISYPDAIAARLAVDGIDFADALHVNKSVIHDRELVDASPSEAAHAERHGARAGLPGANAGDGIFARPDGSLVDASAAQDDLVRFFRRWRPYLLRHGMIALEPHALTVDAAAALSGRSMTAVMEALHGFSGQYLVTLDRFTEAIGISGLRLAAQRLIGSELTGHVHMSCSHLVAKRDSRHGL